MFLKRFNCLFPFFLWILDAEGGGLAVILGQKTHTQEVFKARGWGAAGVLVYSVCSVDMERHNLII